MSKFGATGNGRDLVRMAAAKLGVAPSVTPVRAPTPAPKSPQA